MSFAAVSLREKIFLFQEDFTCFSLTFCSEHAPRSSAAAPCPTWRLHRTNDEPRELKIISTDLQMWRGSGEHHQKNVSVNLQQPHIAAGTRRSGDDTGRETAALKRHSSPVATRHGLLQKLHLEVKYFTQLQWTESTLQRGLQTENYKNIFRNATGCTVKKKKKSKSS